MISKVNPSSDIPEDIDLRSIDFPSDALSVRRFRTLFPSHFDQPDRIADGYGNNDFFLPIAADDPDHLVQLTEMICNERTIAAGAYCRSYAVKYPEIMDQEDHDCVDRCKNKLVKSYQLFKLADSPETARLLIQQIERQAEAQAIKRQSKGR